MATDTDIPKFAYRYIFRYFNKVFWSKLVWIVYSPDFGSQTSEVDYLTKQKVQSKTWKF